MIWLDAHLSPRIARWLRDELGRDAAAVRDLGLRDAEDREIFERARESDAILLTKDRDFAEMVMRLGPPPSVIWLRCGNTSEVRLREILESHLSGALEFLATGERLVEIR
jgi:predicted nuclease of predicted toxin-antitoxin system